MLIPGIPGPQDEFDGVGLLDLPARDRPVDPLALRAKLKEYVIEEAVPPAPWSDRKTSLPPAQSRTSEVRARRVPEAPSNGFRRESCNFMGKC